MAASLLFFVESKPRLLLIFLFFCCFTVIFSAPNVLAGNGSITMENDFFGSAGTDRYFTNGLNFTFVDVLQWQWLDNVAAVSHGHARGKKIPRLVSFSLGQDIYTPQDIEEPSLIVDDRPYAGWLYLGLGIHDRKQNGSDKVAAEVRRWHIQDSTEFVFGIIGPQSYAGEVQYWWHEQVIGFSNTREPSGWDNQLANEPTFALLRERRWRDRQLLLNSEWLEFDFIPYLGAAAGTLTIYGSAGAEARLGWHLPDDFGSARHRAGLSASRVSSHHWRTEKDSHHSLTPVSVHLFSKMEGRGVLRDIFLDGNTFTDSHRVDRKPLIFSVLTGVSVLLGERAELTFTHVYQSKEFDDQRLAHVFGALTLSWYW